MYPQQFLASLAPTLSFIINIISVIHSRGWLAGISVAAIFGTVIAGAYAQKQGAVIDAASIAIDGKRIDALNLANLSRRVNRTLMIQEAHHTACISGTDLNVSWRYSGYCRAEKETALEFSVDSESNIPFDRLDCYGYDLKRDPRREHKIQPVLIGPDGMSKKLALPFLAPLSADEPFDVMLRCSLPGCLRVGLGYYTSTLSFDQEAVRRYTVRLLFFGAHPKWVRAYQCDDASAEPKILRELSPVRQNSELSEYLDFQENISAQSARIYLFSRRLGSTPKSVHSASTIIL